MRALGIQAIGVACARLWQCGALKMRPVPMQKRIPPGFNVCHRLFQHADDSFHLVATKHQNHLTSIEAWLPSPALPIFKVYWSQVKN